MIGTPLIGRQHERSVLADALDRASVGQGSTLSVVGEPGIGKSALLDAVEEQAIVLGATVVRARVEGFERDRPFGLLGRLARALPGDTADGLLASLRDVARTAGEAGERFGIADMFVQAVEQLAVDRPVVVLVDDLRWADDPSVLALRSLSSRLATHAVCLVVAARAGEESAGRHLLAAVEPARRLDPGRLSDDEVWQLARRIVGADPTEDLVAHLRRSDGIPAFVVALSTNWSTTAARGSSLSESVKRLVERQLGGLPDGARTMLRLVALVARPVSVSEITTLVDRPLLEVAELIEVLVERRLLVDQGSCLGYRHDLVREAVVESMPSAARRTMQLVVADMCSVGSPSPSTGAPADLGSLTRAERRTVELVADGMTNLDIAEALSVSRRTVESHLYRAYPKLGVSSRLELALLVGRSS